MFGRCCSAWVECNIAERSVAKRSFFVLAIGHSLGHGRTERDSCSAGAVFDSMNDTERRTNGSGDRIKGNGSKRVFRKNDFFGHGMSIIKLRKKYKYKAEKAG